MAATWHRLCEWCGLWTRWQGCMSEPQRCEHCSQYPSKEVEERWAQESLRYRHTGQDWMDPDRHP